MRLTATGEGNNEGLVEIYYRSRWRSFCNHGFDNNDALVICRQLGYRWVNLGRRKDGWLQMGTGGFSWTHVDKCCNRLTQEGIFGLKWVHMDTGCYK